MDRITNGRLHVITDPICNAQEAITACNYSNRDVIPDVLPECPHNEWGTDNDVMTEVYPSPYRRINTTGTTPERGSDSTTLMAPQPKKRRRSGAVELIGGGPLLPLWVRKSLRDLPISTTWADLVAAEPGLQRFMDEVRTVNGTSWETCPESVWYGWAARDPRKGIKGRLGKYIGYDSVPFHAAYRALYGSLKTCRHCLERDPLEADIEADIAHRLKAQGIRPVERQVRCRAGIADIVTSDTVYEVKLALSRGSLFQAVGQVSVYARELERAKRVIVGQWTPDTDRLAVSVRKLGIEVQPW